MVRDEIEPRPARGAGVGRGVCFDGPSCLSARRLGNLPASSADPAVLTHSGKIGWVCESLLSRDQVCRAEFQSAVVLTEIGKDYREQLPGLAQFE